MLNKIFNSETRNFTFAAFLISLSTIFSGILGLLRDRLLAGTFGAGETLDIYFAAFRIPDLLAGILVAGGITVAFLPIFSEEFEKRKEKAFEFANNLLNCSLIFLLAFCLILFFFTPQILKFVTPGFNPIQREKTVFLTRIMFLSPILFGLSSIFSGILQYFNRFLIYSLAPILYNFGIIWGILFFVPIFGIYGLVFGVVLGALLHLLIQIPAAKNSSYHYLKVLNLKDINLKKMLKLMLPSTIGSGFFQLNLIVITALCSMLVPGSIAIFNFSKNLQYFPVGMIGVPFAISVFPFLSRSWAFRKKEKFWKNLSLVFREVLFLTIPLSVLFFILRAQIVRIVLGTGLFGWLETRLTAACLGIFSLSIFAFSIVPLLQKSFYSIQDTRTPTFIQTLSVLINITLSIFFLSILKSPNTFRDFISRFLKLEDIANIQVVALPLALTISGLFQGFSLFFVFSKKTDFGKLGEIFNSLKNILISTAFMGGGVWLILRPLAEIFPLITFWGVFFQTTLAFLFGILIYLSGAFILKSPELKALRDPILKRSIRFE